MLNVLIVDDDKLVREMLKGLIDWESFGFHIISEAIDGLECIEKYNELQPDIIVLDMSMPQKNGLDVIRYIREKDQMTKLLVLSCHDDFHYVKEAMRLNADEYLLKHLLNEQVLIELLQNLKENILEDKENMQFRTEGKLLIKSQLLANLMKHEKTTQAIENKIIAHFPNLKTSQFNMILLVMDSYDLHLEANHPNGRKVIYRLLKNLIDDVLLNQYQYELVDVENGHYVLLVDSIKVSALDTKNELESLINRIKFSMSSYAKYEVRFLISLDRVSYDSMYKTYKMLMNRKFHFFYSDELVSMSGSIPEFKYININMEIYFIKALKREVDNNHFDQLKERLEVKLLKMSQKNIYPKWFKKFFVEIIRSLFNHVNYRYTMEKTSDEIVIFIEGVNNSVHMSEVKVWVLKYVDYLIDLLRVDEPDYDNDYVNEALKYIKTHYSKGVSLVETADYLGVNSSYLSSLFKDLTGINFVDHVKSIRVNKACDYLSSTDMKIKEICEAVGIPNRKYFSKIFKKVVGVNPVEYKRRHRYEN